jgi:predicted phosphodiesterase
MRFAILSDIHSNLEAFQSVLADVQSQNITQIVCLGDVVGYNANPRECLQLVWDLNIRCVKGNHDEYCSGEDNVEDINPRAAKAVWWTRNELIPRERFWLKNLKYTQTMHNFTMVHATLNSPARWGYVFDPQAAAASFAHQTTRVCFCGHTHVPLAFVRDRDGVRGGGYSQFTMDPAKQYLVNVGSVGQPRDNNPRAAYVVYDAEAGTIELRRLQYDLATTLLKIRDAGYL